MPETEVARLRSSFEQGHLSRRSLLRSLPTEESAASVPLFLGAGHAGAEAAEVYDYIVIGAGSAGCALAARLSEDSDVSILVIEAGPVDDSEFIKIPAAFPNLFKGPLDWDYTTTAQEGLNGRSVYIPRGKVSGGSSSLNAMIYMRGHAACYDAWGRDNPGWSYDDLLPLFRRSENNERGECAFHSVGGPLNVADQRDPNVLSKAMVAAAVEQGYSERIDFNGPEQEGFGIYQVTQKGGFRHSSAAAFFDGAGGRDNLVVQGEALVLKLIIENNSCVGVLFEAGSKQFEVRADREVILSAGSIGSPQILLLSGIGPRADLEALGIDVVHDLPGVGRNLQDHFMAPVAYACTKPVTLAHATTPEQAERLRDGMGLLTSNIGEAGGFLTVMDDAAAPDLQFHFAPNYFIADGIGNPEGDGFTLLPGVVGTRSAGKLTLRSADPRDKPLIDPNALADERDLDVLVEGVKIARRILNSSAMDEYRGEEVFPGVAVQSDADIRDYVRGNLQTIYHPVGTCKMGSDPLAVVDAALKVHGIAGLRVADASIMPGIVNGNTNAPSIMIAEKCAELIRSGRAVEASAR